MNIYLIYKFTDYDQLKDQISEFVNNNPSDKIYYFLPDNSFDEDSWKNIANDKINSADVILYLRLMNNRYEEDKMTNIKYELELAQELKKNILVVDIDAGEGSANDTAAPKILYEKDFLDNNHLKCKVIHKLDKTSIKEALFDMEHILFPDTNIEIDKAELLLEQYRIMLDTSERMMDRRQETNNFYITLCSAMLTAIVAFIAIKPSTMIWSGVTSALSFLLYCLCDNWLKTLEAYGLSNQAKYEVLNMIEKKLPASIFSSEWAYGKMIHYSSYSKREANIPKAFKILFMIICIFSFILCIASCFGFIPNKIF